MRVVVDASVLIEINNAGERRRLRQFLERGDIGIAIYTLRKLKKSAKWRDWVTRNESLAETRLNPGAERQLFAELLARHGMSSAGATVVADDDIMGIVIAAKRGLPLAIRDKAAESIAVANGVRCLGIEEFWEFLDRQQVRQLSMDFDDEEPLN